VPRHHVFPAQEGCRDSGEDPIGGLADHRERDDRGDDLRRLAQLLPVDEEESEPLGGAHELGRHHEHPAEAEPRAWRDDIGRQHRGQQDASHHGTSGAGQLEQDNYFAAERRIITPRLVAKSGHRGLRSQAVMATPSPTRLWDYWIIAGACPRRDRGRMTTPRGAH
jgi:hypothetical protein